MIKLTWKLRFYLWAIIYGVNSRIAKEQAELCWRENPICKRSLMYFTPKEAVLWYLGWSKK